MEKEEIQDEELVYQFRMHDEIALDLLITKYHNDLVPMAISLLRQQNCPMEDDAKQIALIGLMSAIETWRIDKEAGFHYYAIVCAEREIRSLVRHEKAKGLYTNFRCISLDKPLREPEGIYLVDQVPSLYPEFQPEWVSKRLELKERVGSVYTSFDQTQQQIYLLWQQDYSYLEIGHRLGISSKKVDNVLQIVKKRLRSCVDYQN